ncbi:type II toxin-antitoxin system prevent-host-death family antitoxin [Deinococcus multiflagellatus]|uniref:Type II toxin-antitoxin system prevent-host-death family antitoxin n=1 Tax=Deinococcus multiflagellatus TaxID=1656887 RepID=A0ABW1ZT59_9DEIO|nr:type II toxin-antitoxin system prevent-host-death family antitoxin [Deinococcus multiflagellatus]MBZ9714392.1 type II toxin-antitoxin system prevent-host-death family antitoxin [Deinococcus multiflagellatus]
MPTPKTPHAVKTRDLRAALADVLQRVERGERVLIERYTDPVAALVPLADYQALLRLDAHPITKEQYMAHRIVVSNISGGEGKTSITRELALTLADQGFKVALIDSDPQGSLTKNLGFHDPVDGLERAELPGYQREHTILSAFENDDQPRLGPPLQIFGVDVWVSNDALYEADQKIGADLTKMGNLREAVDDIAPLYDFILIDTKPGITPLLNAAVSAADHLIVPISGDKGFENLDKIVKLVKGARPYAPGLGIRMFIPNRVRSTTNVYKDMLAMMQEYAAVAPVSSPIRDSVLMMDAQRARKPLVKHKPTADITDDVRRVARDLLRELGVATTAEPVTP